MNNKTWTIFIALGWLVFITSSQVLDKIIPSSHWLIVNSVFVDDATANKPHTMVVDRVIVRPFHAKWSVDVDELTKGGFVTICSAMGAANYSIDNVLPDPVTLDWWTWPTKCNLEAGRYRLDTRWRIEPIGYSEREVRSFSNVFLVK